MLFAVLFYSKISADVDDLLTFKISCIFNLQDQTLLEIEIKYGILQVSMVDVLFRYHLISSESHLPMEFGIFMAIFFLVY